MQLITAQADLEAACARLASADFIAVDTEFLRETTFYPKLCVVQIAGPEDVVVIDALAPGLDLTPVFRLMADERVLKVFHAARQDIEIVWHGARLIPHPVFDTQIAAMVCGFGEAVSYDQLVRRLTGAHIDKTSRFTDWSRRPLTERQLEYAASDVTHLREVYRALSDKLRARGREDWVREEMDVLTSPATYDTQPEDAWRRLKLRVRKPRELAILMELAAWREREARSRDVPRSRVLKDDAIYEIATQAPRTAEALGQLRAFPKGMDRSRTGAEVLEAVARGLARDPKTLPPLNRDAPLPEGASATVELLKVLLRMTAETEGVAAKIIATVDELERIAADDQADVPALRGWRRELFGDKALRLKRGELALAVEGSRVIAVERATAANEVAVASR
ncbi:MAG: ribonuclease D [Pseudomonadota bacterium]|nr:ribonuclease D [Pseudomonadota bacterium]